MRHRHVGETLARETEAEYADDARGESVQRLCERRCRRLRVQQNGRYSPPCSALRHRMQRRIEWRDRRAEGCVQCVRRHANHPAPGQRYVVLVKHDTTFTRAPSESTEMHERRSLLLRRVECARRSRRKLAGDIGQLGIET